ncbi:hypothetical protein OG21DRAFT_1431819 [Imleria badia]|nr:hypothetical protein OG21DRAFT_1431819 [Imleria badia]
MEDTQPNEVRLSRNIPRVRTTRPIHNPYPSNRVVVIHLPRECHKGAPGGYNARKRWIEDQKHHLKTDRHLSVVSFRLNHDNTVRFECRAQQATRSTGHHARDGTGPHLVDAHLNTKNTSFTPQAPSTGSHSGFAQVLRLTLPPRDLAEFAAEQ